MGMSGAGLASTEGPGVSLVTDDCSIRLLLADERLTRVRLRTALQEEEAVVVCGEAEDAEGAIMEARRTQPHVSIIGWDIPGGGLTAVKGILEVDPRCAVVVLASTGNIDDFLDCLRAGAIGYVPGGATSEGLRRVVRAVMANEAVIPRSMVTDLVLELRVRTLGTGRVTSREAQVLTMLQRGRSTADIADRLSISPVTVRRHISDLVRKLGVDSRAVLVHPEPPAERPSS
jgi:DNA-binding NarL/FixJ family response regulator